MTQVQDILKTCTIDGTTVKLPPGQLERKLYQEIAKSLELIGGKWKGGKTMGFVFPSDPSELLQQIANGEKRNLKKEFQFFGTPQSLAKEMVFYADIKQGESILEPSAGQGAIIDEIIKLMHDDNNLFYVEQMNTNLSIIYKKYGHIKNVFDMHPLNDDFLLLSAKCFDKIIANPPFNKNQDIDHIYKMYECLNPGGRIVTIASKHWLLSSNKKEKAFKEWLYNTVESDVNTIDAGTFSESGTKIETCLIIIDKPLN